MTRLIAMLLAIAPGLISAQTFCALTVRIQKPDGTPATRTWVDLVDPVGKVVKSDFVRGDVYTACDLGPGAYSVTIAPNGCYPVTVSNLRLTVGRPIHLTIRKMPCEVFNTDHTGCDLVLRLRDQKGGAIVGANVSLDGHLLPEPTDEFGRAFIRLSAGHKVVSATADSFQSGSIHLQCDDGANIDRALTLAHVKASPPE